MPRRETYGKNADRALDLWVKLARAFATFNRLTVDDIRRFGLTQAQFGALECLGHLGPLTPGELCEKQLVSGGNMTVIVDNLQKEGLVARVRSRRDRRSIVVRLTPKGERLFHQVFPGHAQYVARLASALTAGEQVAAGRLLKKLGLALVQRNDPSPKEANRRTGATSR